MAGLPKEGLLNKIDLAFLVTKKSLCTRQDAKLASYMHEESGLTYVVVMPVHGP